MGKHISRILKGELVTSVFYILLGLGLIMAPVQMINIICKVVFGLVLIGAGVYHLYIYLQEKENTTVLDLFTGVIVLVLGCFLFWNPMIVVKLLPFLLGAFVLVDSIWTLRGCRKLYKWKQNNWKILLIGSLVFIALGVVLLWNPFPKVKQFMVFAGWVILLNGILDLVFLVMLRKSIKDIEEAVEEHLQEQAEEQKEEEPAVEEAVAEESVVEEAAAEAPAAEVLPVEEPVVEEPSVQEERNDAFPREVEKAPAEETPAEAPSQEPSHKIRLNGEYIEVPSEKKDAALWEQDEEVLEEWKD